jgi:hypothetical protein
MQGQASRLEWAEAQAEEAQAEEAQAAQKVQAGHTVQ